MIWKEVVISAGTADAQVSVILDAKNHMIAAVYEPAQTALVRLAPQLRDELRSALSVLKAMKQGAAIIPDIEKVLAECP